MELQLFAPGKQNFLNSKLQTSDFRVHALSTTSHQKRFMHIKRHCCVTYINCSINVCGTNERKERRRAGFRYHLSDLKRQYSVGRQTGQNPILPAGTHTFPASLPDGNLSSMPHGPVLCDREQNIDNLSARGLCAHVFL